MRAHQAPIFRRGSNGSARAFQRLVTSLHAALAATRLGAGPRGSGAGIWIDGTAHPGVGTWTERTTGEPGTLYGGGRGRWDACMVQPSTGHMAWPWVLGGAGSVGAGHGDVRPRVLREGGDEPLRVCGARACCCCCVRGAVHQRRRVNRGVLWRIATRHLPRAAAPGTTARSNLYIYISVPALIWIALTTLTHHAPLATHYLYPARPSSRPPLPPLLFSTSTSPGCAPWRTSGCSPTPSSPSPASTSSPTGSSPPSTRCATLRRRACVHTSGADARSAVSSSAGSPPSAGPRCPSCAGPARHASSRTARA